MLLRRLAYVFTVACLATSGCDDPDVDRTDAGANLDARADPLSDGGSVDRAATDGRGDSVVPADGADGPIDARTDVADGGSIAMDDAGRAVLQMDCRPRYDDVGEFASRCQYILVSGAPAIRCAQRPAHVGSLEIVVVHPERIRLGVPVSLGGADPTVTIAGGYATPRILVQTKHDGLVSGTIVFDELAIGVRIRGRLADVQVTAQPDPPFSCRLSNGEFLADEGAGVRDR